MYRKWDIECMLNRFNKWNGIYGRYISQIYTSASLIEDQVKQLMRAMHECILPGLYELNGEFIDLANFVNDYFDNLDLRNEINDILQEWADSGKFESIINNALVNYQGAGKMELNRIFREMNYRSSDNLQTTTQPQSMQGGVYTENNNIFYVLWNSGDSSLNQNKLIEANYKTGNHIKEREYNLGWCNGAGYNPDSSELYVVPRGRQGEGNLGELVIIDYTTLDIKQTYKFTFNIQDVSYDKISKKLYVLKEGARSFCEISSTDYSVLSETYLQWKDSISEHDPQCFDIVNSQIYVTVAEPNYITVFDILGNIYRNYNIDYIQMGLYYVGEIQFITNISNSEFIVGSNDNIGIGNVSQFWEIDFLKNEVSAKNSWYTNTTFGNLTLYVDVTSTSINPDGTQARPFKEIGEAISHNSEHGCLINIASGVYQTLDIRKLDNVRFNGAGVGSTIIYGALCYYTNNIFIQNITFRDIPTRYSQSGTINLHQSNIGANNIEIISSNNENYNAYMRRNSRLTLYSNITLSGNVSYNVYNEYSILDYNPRSYKNLTIQKNGRGSKIYPDTFPLFTSNQQKYDGTLPLPDDLNYIAGQLDTYFNYITFVIDYNGYKHLHKSRLTSLSFSINESNCSTTQVSMTNSKVYYNYDNSTNILTIELNSYNNIQIIDGVVNGTFVVYDGSTTNNFIRLDNIILSVS